MLIRACRALALYCPRCGKIVMHELNPFRVYKGGRQELTCDCGCIQGAVVSASGKQYLLEVPCSLCQTQHVIVISPGRVENEGIARLYCVKEHIEMGFVGDQAAVQEAVARHESEFERLLGELRAENDIKNPGVMIEALNKVHSIAEAGHVRCRCGSTAVQASVLYDSLDIYCLECGSHRVFPVATQEDLHKVMSLRALELPSHQQFHRKR